MLGLILALGLALAVAHLAAVCLTQALRTYSRSRLEALARASKLPGRADQVALDGDRTERSAEVLSTLTGLALAALLGAGAARMASGAGWLFVAVVLVAALAHLAIAAIGRIHAERVILAAWPWSAVLRRAMGPLTGLAHWMEVSASRRTQSGPVPTRPASVEVEVRSADASEEDVLEAELPETTRVLLERAIELSRRDIMGLFTPKSEMIELNANASPMEAARAFIDSGFSRIPLYGENRNDIVGILHAMDLFAQTLAPDWERTVVVRKLARAPRMVPRTKDATKLLVELQAQSDQIALVVDEYGTTIGLVTLTDLLEELIGPIEEEHAHRRVPDPVQRQAEGLYEVAASVPIEELNERLGIDLPTDEGYTTVGGLAFTTLGRLPSLGTRFQRDGIEFTVISIKGHAIRRLRVNLAPESAAIGRNS